MNQEIVPVGEKEWRKQVSQGWVGGSKFFQNFSEFGTLTREGATGTFSADARSEQTWNEDSDQVSLSKKR
jgi:hypothetical protein